VPSSRVLRGIRVGFIAAAATAGVIVGLGVRHGEALTPFFLTGRSLLATLTGALAPPVLATVAGLLVHAFWMLLWSVCFTLVAASLRGMRLALAAALCAVVVRALGATVLPGALGAGALASLSAPQTWFLLTLFALSLFVGTRLADSGLAG
jgi:hypothetical protein